MTSPNYNDALQHLLSAINILSPDGKTQAAFLKIVRSMERDGASPSDICAQLTCALFDGLTYNNWPRL